VDAQIGKEPGALESLRDFFHRGAADAEKGSKGGCIGRAQARRGERWRRCCVVRMAWMSASLRFRSAGSKKTKAGWREREG